MILDDLADLFTELHTKYKAREIARHFERDRRWIYSMKCGCGFHFDYSFIAGLKHFGYELKLVKVDKGELDG